jgi:hypothetical protein
VLGSGGLHPIPKTQHSSIASPIIGVFVVLIVALDNVRKLHICCQMLSIDDTDGIPDMLAAVQQAYLDAPVPGSDTGFHKPDPDFLEGSPLEIDTGFPEPDPDYPEDDPYAVVPEDPPAQPTAFLILMLMNLLIFDVSCPNFWE